MAAIQKRIVKWAKRNPLSRRLHVKDDEEAIVSWRLDLDKIRRVLDVRSFNWARSLLTFRSQDELATRTDVDVSEIQHEVSNANVTTPDQRPDVSSAGLVAPEVRHDISNADVDGSDVRHDVVPTLSTASGDLVNLHAICSSIYPNTSKNKDAYIQNRAVGARTIPAAE